MRCVIQLGAYFWGASLSGFHCLKCTAPCSHERTVQKVYRAKRAAPVQPLPAQQAMCSNPTLASPDERVFPARALGGSGAGVDVWAQPGLLKSSPYRSYVFFFTLSLKVSSYPVLLLRSLSCSLHLSVIDAYKYKVNGPIGFLFLASSKGQLMGGVHENPRLQVFTLWPHFNSWNRIYVHIYIFLNKGSLELTTFFLMVFWVHLSQLGDHAVELCGSQMGISASSPK